jgi:alpha-tubulin suppressor-like RCC1 family protein
MPKQRSSLVSASFLVIASGALVLSILSSVASASKPEHSIKLAKSVAGRIINTTNVVSTPYAWGDATNGELGNGASGYSSAPVEVKMPSGVSFVTMATGYYFNLAIDQTGRVWAWGANGFGQLGNGTTNNSPVPVKVSAPDGVTFTAVAVGGSHGIALDNTGKAWTWGRNFSGELGNGTTTNSVTPVAVNIPPNVTFTAIAAGESFSLALDRNGQAWAWGFNSDGELGNGNTTNSSTPVAVNMPSNTVFTQIAGGSYHAVTLDQSGNAWTWGFNASGQLGNGNNTASSSPVSVAISNGKTLISVAAGSDHSLALDSTGQAWAWGNNFVGQLGNGTMTNSSSPVAVNMPGGVTFTAVVTGDGSYHSMALDHNGQAWTWGNNSSGELGDGNTSLSSVPVAVNMPAGVTFVTVGGGSYHSIGLDGGGKAWSWGDNEEDQLGNNTTTNSLSAVRVQTPAGTNFVAVSAGAGYSIALDNNGNAWAWGYNGNGALGDGTTNDSSVPIPVTMPPGVKFTAIAAHASHNLALDTQGQIWAWGYNGDGELGDGTTTNRSVPVPLLNSTGVTFTAIAAGGGGHSLALDSNGKAWAWGYNGDGELGNGTTLNSSVPVAVSMPPATTFVVVACGGNHNPTFVAPGQDHSLALDSNGHIWAWGANSYGQLGDGNFASVSTPVPVLPVATAFTAISGGGGPHSLALDNTGKAWAWGNGYFGELGNGTNKNNSQIPVAVTMPAGVTFTAVSAGGGHSVALDNAGQVWAWGENTSGQLGNGTTSDSSIPAEATNVGRVTAIAAGINHTLVLAPPPVQLNTVGSRLSHGNAGAFDVDLPLAGSPGIECRSGGANGDYTLVFTFANTLTTVGGASVTSGTGSVAGNNINSSDAHNYIVNLTGVTNAQYITVSLTNVTDSAGNFSSGVSASMGVLLGDVNASGLVDGNDVSAVQAGTRQTVNSTNFRMDANVSGLIDGNDVSLVQSNTRTSLPSPP